MVELVMHQRSVRRAAFFAAAAILVALTTIAAAQNMPSPSQVKPIVPVPPRNPGVAYPGTVTICHHVCTKTRQPSPAAPVCVQWRQVC
jgi:hypothetical protein